MNSTSILEKIWSPIIIALIIGVIWSLSLSVVTNASNSSTQPAAKLAVDCLHNRGQPTKLDPDCRPISPEPQVPRTRSAANRNPDNVLYEAGQDEIWITHPTIGKPSRPAPVSSGAREAVESRSDSTPPSPPTNLIVKTSGLFGLSGSWDASVDPESSISYYAYAIGTGTTEEEETSIKWWQSTGSETNFHAGVVLSENQVYYVSVYAVNGLGVLSEITRSEPFTVTVQAFGEKGNEISYEFSPIGYDASGNATTGWSDTQQQDISKFLDRMFPVLYDMYGPPSISYTVTLVRNQQNANAAIFYPSMDEIHLGGNAPYQLITHEFVHAWRNDRILSSDDKWQYDPTLSGFEEGFAQAASYDAMTEFARRYPDFGLSQTIYQSSHEWDYDFQNVEELRTKDFWSDKGGMNLFWVRYEMGAAAIAKIQLEHPNFYRQFNQEYYRRLNADPNLTVSRELVVDIIESITPTIEGKPVAQWIDEQHVFASTIYPGKKIWVRSQHYPNSDEYFIFNNIYFYNTFSTGSDWQYWDGTQWKLHELNGSRGDATLYDYKNNLVWERPLQIEPVDNPPTYWGFGSEEINHTTQASHLPWPGGAEQDTITNLKSFGLYALDLEFTDGSTVVTNTLYNVIGEPLYNTSGVFGGILGANGGQISLNHRDYEPEPAAPVINGAFSITRTWATIPDSDNNINSEPGLIDITYIDADGNAYTDTRTINYGSWNGNQLFFFDVAKMHPVILSTTTPTPTPTYTPTVTSTPTITYTPTVTSTPTVSPTVSPTSTPTITYTPTVTSTPTITYTPTVTSTPTVSPTVTSTPTYTPAVTSTPTYTSTLSPTSTPTVTISPTLTVTATHTPSPQPPIEITPIPSNTPTVTPIVIPTPTETIGAPTATPTGPTGANQLYLPVLTK